MANLKADLENKISEVEPAIIKALSSSKIQEYADILTTLAIVHADLTSFNTSAPLIPVTRRKLEELKTEKEILENNPEVKMYLGLLQRHAQLVDAYRLIIDQEEPTIQSR